MLTESQSERYSRQLLVDGFTEAHQQLLCEASVMVIGAGGLGTAVLQYLNAAGVGKIAVVDKDTVQLSNLQRQVIYTEAELGIEKASLAATYLKERNGDSLIEHFAIEWNLTSASKLAPDYDVLVDCSDNYHCRLVTDQIAIELNKPWVYAAVRGWEGQVTVFNYQGKHHYQQIFGLTDSVIPSTSKTEGVMGVTAAVAGSIQAAEAIKIITGQGEMLAGRILQFSLKKNSFNLLEL
ncbi:MAG: HesA/MoeB/ThiF family protein [Bacteroidota bacterium]|nr:MAG: HesA/MoeB/ThiF family protein [Bacteroidota bacterium]